MHYRQVVDFDLDILEEILSLLDGKLDTIAIENKTCDDPDQFGQYDRSESLVGIALVASQNYLTEVMGSRPKEKKKELLSLGPRHPAGHSVAEIIHAGGNYVKHRAEPLENKAAIAVLKSLGVWKRARFPGEAEIDVDYPMSSLLAEIIQSPSICLTKLIPILTAWRDKVIEIKLDEDSKKSR